MKTIDEEYERYRKYMRILHNPELEPRIVRDGERFKIDKTRQEVIFESENESELVITIVDREKADTPMQ